MSKTQGPHTVAVHGGELHPRICGAVSLPIFQSTVFEQTGGAGYHDIVYPRLNNLPNHQVVGAKLAALAGAEAGLVTASGMAAISTALLTALVDDRGVGHLLAQDTLYGGTHTLLSGDFAQMGIATSSIDGLDPSSWEAALRPDTRAIYVESITNPLMQVADHLAVVAFARSHGLVSLIDNTFTSPVCFRPVEIGYDLSLHSATKYLNGHSDVIAGAVVGSATLVDRVRHRLNHLGGTLDPHATWLLHRGLKTLPLRVRRQCESAGRVTAFLAEHPAVTSLRYPGLPDTPGHAHAAALFDGFGGTLSFELAGGERAATQALAAMQLAINGPSLGGIETLICRPAAMSHSGVPRAERQALGITDGLLRLSVGIEDVADIVADLDQALRTTG